MGAASITALSLAGAGLTLLRDVLAVATFGASSELDAFIVAFLIPTGWFALLVGASNYAFVPLAARTLETQGREAFDRLATAFWSLGVGAAVAVLLFVVLVSDPLARALLPGSSIRASDSAADLLRLLAPATAAVTMSPILGALLVAKRRFFPVAVANVVSVLIVVVLLIVLPPVRTVRDYATFCDIGLVTQLGVLLLSARRSMISLVPTLPRGDVLRLIPSLAAGVVGWLAWQLNQVIDRAFASTIADGAVTLAAYSFRIALVFLVAVWPLTTILVASLPSADVRLQRQLTSQAARVLLLFAVPTSGLIFVLRVPIMSTVLIHGLVTNAAALSAAELLGLYAFAIPLVTVMLLLTTTLFATGRRRDAALIGILAMCVQALCDFVAVRSLGITGLPIALLVASSTWVVFLTLAQREFLQPILNRSLLLSVARFVLAAAAAAAAALMLRPSPAEYVDVVYALRIAISALVAMVVYAATLAALGSPELAVVQDFGLRLIQRARA